MVVFQIVFVNDVYEIDNLPHFSTARLEGEADNSVTKQICILPGDFVAPSLLSSLDSGRSMIDCLNAAGLDYASIGNHESDISLENLHCRMRESKFKWLNSNMPTFPLPEDIGSLPTHAIIECGGKKVALLGLAGEDRSVMKAGAFNDCEIIPIKESLKDWYGKLKDSVDLVVPMTHQYMAADRDLAKLDIGCPFIVGGHDHSPFLENINGVQVVKTGMDGANIGIIRVEWDDADPSAKPSVDIKIRPCTDFARDPKVEATVASHKVILKELENSVLFDIPSPFSSKGIRLRPTSTGAFLCAAIRDQLGCEVCCVGSGSIRAQRDYNTEAGFSYAHLKSEFAFPTCVAIVHLPGKVLCEMISFSRAFAIQTPPVEKGAFLQTCNNVTWDYTSNTVTELCGKPVEADRLYKVGVNFQMLEGMDNIQPLMDYKHSQPKTSSLWCNEEAAVDCKHAIVGYFSSRALFGILHQFHGNLAEIDADGDGKITRQEFVNYFDKHTTGDASKATTIMIDNLFAVCDLDRDGVVSKQEILNLAINNLRFYHNGQGFRLSIDEVLAKLSDVVGEMDEELKQMVRNIDTDNDGFITKAEVTAASLSGTVLKNVESVFI